MKARTIRCSVDSNDHYIDVYKVYKNMICLDCFGNDHNIEILLDRDSAETLATALIEFFDELDQED